MEYRTHYIGSSSITQTGLITFDMDFDEGFTPDVLELFMGCKTTGRESTVNHYSHGIFRNNFGFCLATYSDANANVTDFDDAVDSNNAKFIHLSRVPNPTGRTLVIRTTELSFDSWGPAGPRLLSHKYNPDFTLYLAVHGH